MPASLAVKDGSIRDAVVALKRERIVAAAAALFYEHGYESTTLDAVAERLGVRKPFIYSYFKSKSDVLAEICARGIASSLAAIDKAEATSAAATEKLAALGREFVRAVLGNQPYIAIYSREEKSLERRDARRIGEMRREFDHRLTGLLEEGVASGEFRIADTRIASLAIGGMVSWAYVWYRPSGRLDLDEIAERMAELILAMVGATPGALAGGRDQERSRRARLAGQRS